MIHAAEKSRVSTQKNAKYLGDYMPCEGGGNCVESVGTGSVVEPENNSGSVFNMIWDRSLFIAQLRISGLQSNVGEKYVGNDIIHFWQKYLHSLSGFWISVSDVDKHICIH